MKIFKNKSGQFLITLLFFMLFSITITTAAVAIIVTNSYGASKFERGIDTYNIAESGAENAILRILRDPIYTGEILDIGDGTATIQVSGTSPIIITSEGKLGNLTRKIEVRIGYNDSNVLSILSWKEI